MKFKVRQIVSVVGLMISFGIGFAGQAIDRKDVQIRNKFINRSSRDVAAQEESLASQQEVFLRDDKIMQKVQKIHREGSTETTLEVTGLEESISEGFAQKESDLQFQLSQCRPKQFLCGTVVVLGSAAAVVFIASASKQRGGDKTILKGIAGASTLIAAGGGVALYSLSGEKARIENHLAQVHMMQNQWNKFFEMPDLQSFSGVGTDKK